MKKKIYYLGHYASIDEPKHRSLTLSAISKMTYIFDIINGSGYDLRIISNAIGQTDKLRLLAPYNEKKNYKISYMPSLTGTRYSVRMIAEWVSQIYLFFFLLVKLKKTYSLIVYHATDYYKVLPLVKRIIGFRLILEVEEIYYKVQKCDAKKIKGENKMFDIADAFILATRYLNDEVNPKHKPFVEVNGVYKKEPLLSPKFRDGRVHLVYAGTFMLRKGILTAINSAKHLPENYCLHILGNGAEEEMHKINETIEEVNRQSGAQVIYEGIKKGREYNEFLQKCDIGLSPQNIETDFNTTSFPSKILSYMSNGLIVVTIRLKTIENSAIGDSLYYYEEDTPASLAAAIQKVDCSKEYDVNEILSRAENNFREQLSLLLG